MRLQAKYDQTRQKMTKARSILRKALLDPTAGEGKWTEATAFLAQQIRLAIDAMPDEFVPEPRDKHSWNNSHPKLDPLSASQRSNPPQVVLSSGGEPKGKPGV